MTPAQVRTILRDSLRTYLLAEKDLPGVPPHQRVVIRYGDLVKRPRRTVEGIYSRFGLPGPDAALKTALDGLRAGSRVHDSKHEYSLEEFGLTPDELREKLAPVFERYSFTGNGN